MWRKEESRPIAPFGAAMPFVPFVAMPMLLVVRPGATFVASLLLIAVIAMPFAASNNARSY